MEGNLKEDRQITIKEAAIIAKVSPGTIRNYIGAGRLVAEKSVGKWWVYESDLIKAFPHLKRRGNGG